MHGSFHYCSLEEKQRQGVEKDEKKGVKGGPGRSEPYRNGLFHVTESWLGDEMSPLRPVTRWHCTYDFSRAKRIPWKSKKSIEACFFCPLLILLCTYDSCWGWGKSRSEPEVVRKEGAWSKRGKVTEEMLWWYCGYLLRWHEKQPDKWVIKASLKCLSSKEHTLQSSLLNPWFKIWLYYSDVF